MLKRIFSGTDFALFAAVAAFAALALVAPRAGAQGALNTAETLDSLAAKFAAPPLEYRPNVWWHWMGPNFRKEGITKDLEAMKEAGIGGATIFNIASSVQSSHFPTKNNPWPEQTYRGDAYWDAFRHTLNEAERLGLKIGLHGSPGYSTTGNTWVKEEDAMQLLILSKTTAETGTTAAGTATAATGSTTGTAPAAAFEIKLPRPKMPSYLGYERKHIGNVFPPRAGKPESYRDIAVFAVPADKPAAELAAADIVDVSAFFDRATDTLRLPSEWENSAKNSRLPRKYHFYRLGHAPSMANPHPLPDDIIGRALEADKMSRDASIRYWTPLIASLKKHGAGHIGKALTYVWLDSYEAGEQTWTPAFRERFIAAKGYDPLPWLVLQQHTTGDRFAHLCDREPLGPLSQIRFDVPRERRDIAAFVRDWRDLTHTLFAEGFHVAKELLRDAGLLFFWEPYWGPFDTAKLVPLADVPGDEFWNNSRGVWNYNTVILPAAAAGKRIVFAEALTGRPEVSKYTEDPAFLKPAADSALVTGANLFFLHHWVHQPFDDKYQPGLSMGWWGTHFNRHQTWFKQSRAFFTYLARCQMLLQQGTFIKTWTTGDLRFLQRQTPEADIYFIFNNGKTDTTLTPKNSPLPATNTAAAGTAEIWRPYENTIETAPTPTAGTAGTAHPVPLAAGATCFLVLPRAPTRYAKHTPITTTLENTEPLLGGWTVRFQPKWHDAAPFTRRLDALVDLSKQDDPDLKYFAGTAAYTRTLNIAGADLAPDRRLLLDFGALEDIAELFVNDRPAGVLWAPPYRADITPLLRPGANTIRLEVTNNWANRMIGDEQFPADFEWAADTRGNGRAIAAYPDWFLKNEPRPQRGRKTYSLWHYYYKDSPLQPAGLLGPVRLERRRIVP